MFPVFSYPKTAEPFVSLIVLFWPDIIELETLFWVLVAPETIEFDNSFETLFDPAIKLAAELRVTLLDPELNIVLQFESLECNLPTLLPVPTIYEYSETRVSSFKLSYT